MSRFNYLLLFGKNFRDSLYMQTIVFKNSFVCMFCYYILFYIPLSPCYSMYQRHNGVKFIAGEISITITDSIAITTNLTWNFAKLRKLYIYFFHLRFKQNM